MSTVDLTKMSRKDLNAYAVSIGLSEEVVVACANVGELQTLVEETLKVKSDVGTSMEDADTTEEAAQTNDSTPTDEMNDDDIGADDSSASSDDSELVGADAAEDKPVTNNNVEYRMVRNVKYQGIIYKVGTLCPENLVRMFLTNGYAVTK